MNKIFSLVLCIAAILSLNSCDDSNTPSKGSVRIEFDNVVGTDDLELNTEDEPYTNAAGESYNVTTLRYYISNIKLKHSSGSVYEDEVSADGAHGYYLIDEADGASQLLILKDIPVGKYTDITFTIGVDAAKVTEGAQTGALDVSNEMFWSWKSGYIFAKVEGTSSASSDESKSILYHIGGYDSPSNIREKTVSLGSDGTQITTDGVPEIHMIVDVNKFFETPNEISFKDMPVRHMPMDTEVIANNYVNTFVVDHVHN